MLAGMVARLDDGSTPEEFAALIAKEKELLAKVVAGAKIQAE